MAQLNVVIAGVEFKNPIIAASGTYGFGEEYKDFYPPSLLGGISTKGVTLKKRKGNKTIRVAETASGMLNSVGLQNPGLDHFIKNELPRMKGEDYVTIVNMAGSDLDDYMEAASLLDDTDVDMIELNISCPNVKEGGAAFGTTPQMAAKVTRSVRRYTKKPVIVKLSPNVSDIADIARAVEGEGADAVSLINTLVGMRIDINKRRPVLHNNIGGLSGPAVFPVAVRMVFQVANAVDIPVIGMGGIASGTDAVEMMMAGASAVMVGSAMFRDPAAPIKVLKELNDWCDENGIADVNHLVGTVRPYGMGR